MSRSVPSPSNSFVIIQLFSCVLFFFFLEREATTKKTAFIIFFFCEIPKQVFFLSVLGKAVFDRMQVGTLLLLLVLLCSQFFLGYMFADWQSKECEQTVDRLEKEASIEREQRVVVAKEEKERERVQNVDDNVNEMWMKRFRNAVGETKRLGLLVKGVQLPRSQRPFAVWSDVRDEQKRSLDALDRRRMLRVATYNLWNVNEPVEMRMLAIVDELQALDADVIVLQEVRRWNGVLQIDWLRERLGFAYSLYERTHAESKGDEEGHGVLSRLPLERVQAYHIEKDASLSIRGGVGRIVLHARLVDAGVDVFSVHMGIFDVQQCHAATQLRALVDASTARRQIVLGDFNAYIDWEWPLDWLVEPRDSAWLRSPVHPCHRQFQVAAGQVNNRTSERFVDAWPHLMPSSVVGNTFTNFEDARKEDCSRPDRVLSRGALEPRHIYLFGDQAIGKRNGQSIYPSDHRGLLVSFEFQ
jgi:endonuclease/exonuclease/phosphatase family metal-dependent hydrolase